MKTKTKYLLALLPTLLLLAIAWTEGDFSGNFVGTAYTLTEQLDGNNVAILTRNDPIGPIPGDSQSVGLFEGSSTLPLAAYHHTDGGTDTWEYGGGLLHFDGQFPTVAQFDCPLKIVFVSTNGHPLEGVTQINFVGNITGAVVNGQAQIGVRQ